MIDIRDLTVSYAIGTPLEKRVLDGLSLAVSPGEFVCVIGSNGAGKSTLLSAIAGETPVLAGSIRLAAGDVTRMPPARRARYVARVFQDPRAGTCDTLTIAENLALAGVRGKRRGLRRAIAPAARRLFERRIAALGTGLEERLSSRMDTLSGGQRQALALIMATLADSEVLLLDEHTAALDPRNAEFIMRLTARLADELGLTVLMVTHSMAQALEHGHRTVVLHEGRIVADYAGAQRAGLTAAGLAADFRRRHGAEFRTEAALDG